MLPPTKSCPRLRGKWHEVPKGERLKTAECRELSPPQLHLRSAAPPFHGGAFWCSTNSAYSAVPLRGAIVSMGLRGVQGGLRGEIEIFPGPPAKKVIRKLLSLLFISTPQSRLTPCQLPVEGSLLVRFTAPCTISAGRQCVKCSKIVYRLCNHMVYSFDILKASQKKRKRWRWLGRKGLWK